MNDDTTTILTGRRWKTRLDELIDHERSCRAAILGPWERWLYLDRAPERTKALLAKGRQHPELVALNGLAAPIGQPSAPPSSFTAVNTTNVETNLWVPAIWTPIPANSMNAGSIFQANAGGVLGTSSSAPTALWTPRCGVSATPGTNITLGATTASTMIASLAAVPWSWQFMLAIRSLGLAASGATGTGNGAISIGGLTTATGVEQVMGGAVATTLDNTATTGLILSVTWGANAAANTATCQWTAQSKARRSKRVIATAPIGAGLGRGSAALPMRQMVASVGLGTSSVPYGPTNGYATPNGVTGFIGPAAGSLWQPVAWYVRIGGSNTNGGTGTSLSPARSGTGASLANNGVATTLTLTGGALTMADVGQGVCIVGVSGGSNQYYRIMAIISSTQCTVDRSNNGTNITGSLVWNIGGSFADLRPVLGDNTAGIAVTNSGSPLRSGDTVYVGAGTYRNTMSFPANILGGAFPFNNGPLFAGQANIVGDVTGQFTGDAGMVQLTAYTTNDKTAPSATVLLNLNGKSNLSFSNIMFVGGNSNMLTAGATSQNIAWADCTFHTAYTAGSFSIVNPIAAYGLSLNWLWDRCLFLSGRSSNEQMIYTCTTGPTPGLAGQDYNINVLYRNCLFITTGTSTQIFLVTNSGALANKGGGVVVRNCMSLGGMMLTTASQVSTIFPNAVYNSVIYAGGAIALNAGTSGQIIESNNLLVAATPRTNVNAGTGSISDGSYAPLFHFGQERIWLSPLFRAFGEPMANSPLLGFGNDGAQTPYDLRGLNWPRPAGGASALPAVGAMERSNTFIADPSPIGTGVSPIKITGPGYNQFLLPLAASQINQPLTVSIEVEWDSSYVTGALGNGEVATLPALVLVAKPQQGIFSNLVAVATGSPGTPNTVTLPNFTPTAVGVLTLQLISYDLSGASVVRADNFNVT